MRWLWENVIMHKIYGVSILGVFFMLAFTAALFRFFILPYFGGFTFNVGTSGMHFHIPRQAQLMNTDVGVLQKPNQYNLNGRGYNVRIQSGNKKPLKQLGSTHNSGNNPKIIYL